MSVREIEVRPSVTMAGFGALIPDYMEFVDEAEAEFFSIWVQQRDGTFKHYKNNESKDGAMIDALLYAANSREEGVTWSVVYRTEEGEEQWQAGRTSSASL